MANDLRPPSFCLVQQQRIESTVAGGQAARQGPPVNRQHFPVRRDLQVQVLPAALQGDGIDRQLDNLRRQLDIQGLQCVGEPG